MLEYELPIYQKGYHLICGTDEAGRGPIAGPVVAAAVILPQDYQNPEIDDSKKLTAKKREELYQEIIKHAIAYQIVAISAEEIDSINILEASRKAMQIAVDQLQVKPDYILTDFMNLKHVTVPLEALKHGDALSINIAAASILAKVTRDKMMDELDVKYPQYGFKKHKGYPTKEHLLMMNKYGPIKGIYRYTYRPVQQYFLEEFTLV